MFHVIVEKSRVGAGYGGKMSRSRELCKAAIRGAAQDDLRFDEPPAKESMFAAHGHGRKALNENLSPLYGFLRSRVGQPWNDVYSELREHLDSGSAVKMHVVQHLKDFVELNTAIVDGVVGYYNKYVTAEFRPISELGGGRYYGLYVHPASHRLCRAESRSYRTKRPDDPNVVKIDAMHRYLKIENVWYWVELAKRVPTLSSLGVERDVFAGKTSLRPNALRVMYGIYDRHYSEEVYAAAKRQLNKREIKRLGLR